MNTMKDLRREVQHRLHETIDGREMDMMEGPTPRIPHMLGITSMNAIHTRHAEEDTLLDPDHQFWQDYEDEIKTKSAATSRIESAVRSLKRDGTFEMTYPYGEEADIVYCEVEPVEEQKLNLIYTMKTSCPECQTELHTSPSLDLTTGSGHIKVSVDCTECEFSAAYETTMHRK